MAVERSPSGSSLIDVLDRVLDKGIVIDAWVRALSRRRRRSPARQRRQLSLERADLLAQLVIFRRQGLLPRRQMMIVFPPVQTDLLGLVDRADEQADPDREQLDFGERHLDVAGHDEPLVQNPVENVDQARGSSLPFSQ